jgi:hypothetical protein
MVTHAADVSVAFSSSVSIAVCFYVFASCTVPSLMGRDALQHYRAVLDYGEEVCTFFSRNTTFAVQLCSRQSLQKLVDDAQFIW